MDPTIVVKSLITPAPQLHPRLLQNNKRAYTLCGDLQNSYHYLQAPVCAGQTSLCTFSGAYQGCCDDGGQCTYYTTCNGYYASADCSAAGCIKCANTAAYCVKYNFYDSSQHVGYEGYSCATFNPGSDTVFGVVASMSAGDSTLVSDSATLTKSGSDSSASSPSTGSNTSGSRTATSTTVGASPASSSASASPSTSSNPSTNDGPTEKKHLSGGAIGGIVAALIILIIAIFALCWCCCYRGREERRRAREKANRGREPMRYLQQTTEPED